MESSASQLTPEDVNHHHHHHPHRHHFRIRPNQPVAERIDRAIHHRLLLLHRSESNFFILGATGNVYTVTLATNPSCTCPDRTTPCKHILFVYIRVLGVSLDDTCIRRRTLRPCQLNRLLGAPTLPEALAGARLRERFHELFFPHEMRGQRVLQPVDHHRHHDVVIEDGTTCPICLDKMENGWTTERVVACGTCRNVVHEDCLMKWKRSRGRRAASCVICRARWRENNRNNIDQERYLNLAAYIREDDDDTAPCAA